MQRRKITRRIQKKKLKRKNLKRKNSKRNKNTIKHIKRNNIKIRIKNLGKTKTRKNKNIQYGCSKNMKGGDATLNPISEVGGYIENSFSSLGSTLNGDINNNIINRY